MPTFVESPLFTRLLEDYLSDDEYRELQFYLTEHPDAGAVIRGSGGVRKLRWAAKGRGKRGGVRVIYFLKREREELWLLTLYGKNVQDDIPAQMLRRIKEALDDR